jgi:electron transport complex protein RnfC
MKMFSFRGGVHPLGNKTMTTELAIEKLPLPQRLYIPLQQHIGAPATAIVNVGDRVLKGQLIAKGQGAVSAPVHASSSGVVVAIEDHSAPHPSGLPVRCIVIDTDGEDRWYEEMRPIRASPFEMAPDVIAQRVASAGLVGLGGAAFPSAVKLSLALKLGVNTLIINGAECEPYLTADDRLMQERAADIIKGIRLMLHAIQAPKAVVVIEDNKPEALKQMQMASVRYDNIEIMKVPTRYPMGSEKQMIYTVTGLEIPAGKRAADIGVMMHNVGTAFAAYEAVYFNKPLVTRIVTISGSCITQPRNLEVPIGTLITELIDYCGGLREEPARLLMGGPLMGMVLPNLAVPVIKGSNGVLALTQKELSLEQQRACIRCGRCVSACPCGLLPLDMAANIKAGKFDRAVELGVNDCISCGSCAYVCPSSIPLVHHFNYAKGELNARSQAKVQQQYTAQLAQQRKERLERQEKAKQVAAAAAAAKKAKEAAAAAAAESEVASQ